MYILLVYDISENKVNKVMKVCREYLEHIQNSVFEGEITLSHFRELKSKLHEIIDFENDSIIIYELWKINKEIIGVERRNGSNFI